MAVRIRRAWVGPAVIGSGALVVVAAGGVASFETGTVGSFWEGLWWAVSLMTTVGFIDGPPATATGAALSVVLMLVGFLLLAAVSAALASLFVREDVEPFESQEREVDRELLQEVRRLHERLDGLERRLGGRSDGGLGS